MVAQSKKQSPLSDEEMRANAAFKTVADTAKAAAAIGAPLQPVLVTLLMPSIIAVALAYDARAIAKGLRALADEIDLSGTPEGTLQ